MTRPAPEILWDLDPDQATTVWAVGQGLGWHYTLYWGDGTHRDMTWQSQAVPKRYTVAGTYTVLAVSSLYSTWTASAVIPVRDFVAPTVSAQLLDDRRTVALEVPPVADPVRWRVDWGDGTVTEHGAEETPGHTYEWNTGAATITVTDVPSQRATTLTGPTIGPAPQPPPTDVSGWFWRYTGRNRRFVLYGTADPRTEVRWSSWSWDQVRTATADDRGQVAIGYDMPEPIYPGWDTWRSYTVQHRQNGATVTQFVPVHVPRAQDGTPDVVYDLDEADAQRLTLSVLPAQTGTHHVDFGDGTDQQVHVDEPPLRVVHRYTSSGPFQVRITLPDGRTTEPRRIAAGDPNPCGPAYNPHYPGLANVTWWFPAEGCGKKMVDPFDPVVMHVDDHMPHQLHCPNADGFNTAYGYQFTSTGWKTFGFLAPLSAWRTTGVTIEQVETRQPRQRGFEMHIEDDTPDLPAEFQQGTAWEGGYSGEFTVDNHTEREVGPWQLEFTLPPDARAAEVWPADQHNVVSLGAGRWRVSCDSPIPASTTAHVGVRVEPCGKAKSHPNAITAREKPLDQ